MKPLLIYCYDAYCGWCYGFSPVMQRVAQEYAGQLDFEVLSGGMIMPAKPAPVSSIAPFIQGAYKTVESYTGIRFGEDFLWHIFHPDESDWFPSSLKPAIALSVFKEYLPGNQIEFAGDLQYALNFEGRDLTDDEAYRHLLEKYKIPADEFYANLREPHYRQKAEEEFETVRLLRVNGFPSAFIQTDEGKFYQVLRGYTDYLQFKATIDNTLHSLTNASSSL